MQAIQNLDAQKVFQGAQIVPLVPYQITLQLGPYVVVTTDLRQYSNSGAITYTVSSPLYSLQGDTVGSTNNSDEQLTLQANMEVGNLKIGTVTFSVTSGANSSTAEVTVTFNGGSEGVGYNGVIACWNGL